MRVSQMLIAGLLACLLAAGAWWLGQAGGWRLGALFLVGGGLGLSLYHASFGFAGAFRALLADRRGAGLRAQMVMLAVAVLLFQPALAQGVVAGQAVRGFVFPVGMALLVGAFLFGIGMQLGGGCASGTLYAVGGGGARALLTLSFFIAGATLAALDVERWGAWPALPAFSLPGAIGATGTIALSLLVFALVWTITVWLERRRHGQVAPIGGTGHVLSGPWPKLWGALALAALNFATLLLAGRPWAITASFPLWGSHIVQALRIDDPVFWPYWDDPTRAEALLRPLWMDRIGVMDAGLVLGAALAAFLAGRGGLTWHMRAGQIAGSVTGGLLLGYGAMLATGCNVSAYLSGIASGSLHGWVWIVPGLLGNQVGLWLRPLFRLDDT
jgi:uncharacterized membrane protein YedE/YeeE